LAIFTETCFDPIRSLSSLKKRCPDHTQRRTTVCGTPMDEWTETSTHKAHHSR